MILKANGRICEELFTDVGLPSGSISLKGVDGTSEKIIVFETR